MGTSIELDATNPADPAQLIEDALDQLQDAMKALSAAGKDAEVVAASTTVIDLLQTRTVPTLKKMRDAAITRMRAEGATWVAIGAAAGRSAQTMLQSHQGRNGNARRKLGDDLGKPADGDVSASIIRDWARRTGLEVPQRGRIPFAVRQAYADAQA